MSDPRASNPAFGSSLLDRSKATPGSVNMAIFEKKTAAGQGTVNSNYLQQTREDNPEPVADQAETKATLSNCKITTDPEKLAAEQPFEMSADIKGPEASTSGTVTFNLFCCIPKADGTETVEDESSPATGTVKDGTVVAKGTLVSPKDPVAAGTKLKYYVVAQHASATEKVESPKVEVEAGKTPEPLAVWCLGSVHFGFGSSFIMPSVASELASLKKLKDQNTDAGYAVFGHADPVGEDDFNKTLSGRRANAVYCLLTHNADGWVQLSKGVDGDKWSTKAHQTILSFLKNDTGAPFYSGSINGSDDAATKSAIESFQKFAKLKPDGIVGPQTKAKLYAVYMDKLSDVALKPEDFVGDPKDPKVQWACSGCSEFNPLLVFSKTDENSFKSAENQAERNSKNAPNRRATVFLFPSGTKGPGNVTFPCPTWTDNSAKCKKQWFSDADKRRNPTDGERTWETAKDTFACQFYAKIGKAEKSGAAITSNLAGKKFKYEFPIKRLKSALNTSDVDNAVFWLGSIYGREVPAEIYSKLIGMVQDDKIELAPCNIVASGEALLRGHDGAYDEETKTIYLSEELFSKNDGYGILTAVVTEEFGHHLEKLIKELYRSDYEAPDDEGACYAWHLLTMSLNETGKIVVGQVEGGDEISTTVESLQNALETNLTEEDIAWDDKYRAVSFTGGMFTLDDLTEREFNGKNFKMHEAFGTIAAGATITIRSWGRGPDHVSVADAAGKTESVPVESLDRIPEPKVLTYYKCGLDTQRTRVADAQKRVDDWKAEEPKFKSNHQAWVDELNNRNTILSNRRKEYGRRLAREFMYNRFDARIKHWVDHYNALMKPKASLDANVAKSLAFEEGHIGTVGEFFHTPAVYSWGFNGDNPVMSRFNLMQAIDSLFQQQILMIQEMNPVLFSSQKFGTLQITLEELMARKETRKGKIYIVWKELDVKNPKAHPGEVEVVLKAMEGFAIKTAKAAKQPVPNGIQMGVYTDYDFWIRCGVFWLIYKYKVTAKQASWPEGVKRYNGNGAAAEHYRDRVFKRITDTVKGELYVGDT
jgi:outer membrane protein OmpA-like peptidoglycan-associated protein